MQDAVIVSTVRTPVGKAPRGALVHARPDDMAATVIKAALERVPALEPAMVDDVILGCAMPEAEQGMNFARIALLLAGLPDSVPGMTVNRYCSSGLQTIAMAAQSIMTGMSEAIIAGGSESMTRVPMGGVKPMANPRLVIECPDMYINMGLTAENVAEKFGITREEMDVFAVESHKRACAAQASGRFADELVPVEVIRAKLGKNAKLEKTTKLHAIDEGPRADTTLEGLGRLKPAFRAGGSVTAGNSSQMSDGAAASVIMSGALAAKLGIKPLARFVSFAVGGVDPGLMGIGPVVAIPKALKLAGLTVNDIDLIELNEAFAAQALYCIRTLGLDPAKVNVNGGAIALGHPLGCTGAKLTATLVNELKKRNGRYGIVSMCIGGGMGAAGIIQNIN